MKSGIRIGNITRIHTGIAIASSIGTNIAILRIIRVRKGTGKFMPALA